MILAPFAWRAKRLCVQPQTSRCGVYVFVRVCWLRLRLNEEYASSYDTIVVIRCEGRRVRKTKKLYNFSHQKWIYLRGYTHYY